MSTERVGTLIHHHHLNQPPQGGRDKKRADVVRPYSPDPGMRSPCAGLGMPSRTGCILMTLPTNAWVPPQAFRRRDASSEPPRSLVPTVPSSSRIGASAALRRGRGARRPR